MYDAALLLGLRVRVGKEQALATDNRGLEDQHAAMFTGVDRVDLLVKRLLVGPGTIDEDGNDVRMAQPLAVVPIVRFLRRSRANARPFLLRLLQGFPDTAHGNPQVLPAFFG